MPVYEKRPYVSRIYSAVQVAFVHVAFRFRRLFLKSGCTYPDVRVAFVHVAFKGFVLNCESRLLRRASCVCTRSI